jgi:hypothetical protein
MSKDRSEELTEHHNDGWKDAQTGDYNPPRDWADTHLTHDHVIEKYKEDNEAYSEGWRNQHDQRK